MIEKIGRNDSCPCGSGRKYKRCCNDQVVSIDTFVERKLNDIQLDFMRWAMQEHKSEIGEHLAPYYRSMNIPKEAEETLNFFSSLWYMTSVKREGTTLLEDYLEEHVPQIKNPSIREVVSSWTRAEPSVFIVKSWAPDGYVVIEDAFTEETRWVKLLDPKHHQHRQEGVGIGTILPIERGGLAFFTTFFYVPASLEESQQIAKELTKQLQETGASSLEDYMSISFMEVLQYFMFGKKIERPVAKQTEVKSNVAELAETSQTTAKREVASTDEQVSTGKELTPGQAEVLDAYNAYTAGRENTAQLQEVGTSWWITYCEQANPILRKPQVAAAALYYLVDEVCFSGNVTQVQLAKDFVISATSISSRYNDMIDVLADEISEQKALMESALQTS